MTGKALFSRRRVDTVDDAGLLARGDDTAVELLYDRHAASVFNLGLRLLGDRGLAEEVVQETFVRLWRNAHRYEPERGSVSTFLFALTRNVAIDLWRRSSSRPHDEHREEVAFHIDPIEDLVQDLEVQGVIRSLPPRQREVLELTCSEGLKQQEIAERLGVPLGTVKTWTYHALHAVRNALDDRGGNA